MFLVNTTNGFFNSSGNDLRGDSGSDYEACFLPKDFISKTNMTSNELKLSVIPVIQILNYFKRLPETSSATIVMDFGVVMPKKKLRRYMIPSQHVNESQTYGAILTPSRTPYQQHKELSQQHSQIPSSSSSSVSPYQNPCILTPRFYNIEQILKRLKFMLPDVGFTCDCSYIPVIHEKYPLVHNTFKCNLYFITSCVQGSVAYETKIHGTQQGKTKIK